MRANVVIVVRPFADLVVQDICIVDQDAVEKPVELLGIDAVGPLDAPMFVNRRFQAA